jgi:hypothetical protein
VTRLYRVTDNVVASATIATITVSCDPGDLLVSSNCMSNSGQGARLMSHGVIGDPVPNQVLCGFSIVGSARIHAQGLCYEM